MFDISRFRDTQIIAYLSPEIFLDLTVAWNGGHISILRIFVDRMFASLAKESAAEAFNVSNQIIRFISGSL